MSIRTDTDDLIHFLNSLAQIDPVAMGRLCATRVPCGRALAEHPTIQASAGGESGYTAVHVGDSDVPAGEFRVGMLGILNGYLGVYDYGKRRGWGPITAVVGDDGSIREFYRTPNEPGQVMTASES